MKLKRNIVKLNELQFIPCDKVSKIITIENLTSFNRFNAEEAIIIYLGGYSLNNSPNNFNLLFNQHKSQDIIKGKKVEVRQNGAKTTSNRNR